MSDLIIDINLDSHYSITGQTDILIKNRRARISLDGLGYKESNGLITIEFTNQTKISILDSIKRIAEELDLSINLEKSVDALVGSYKREQDNFIEFSNKAKMIRNNQFNESEELVEGFKKFKDVIIETFDRKLYDFQLLSAYHMAFSQNSCNFSVPGAGKTSIVYGAYSFLRSLNSDDRRYVDKILIIGPLSSFAPWESEYEECFGIKPTSQRLSGDSSISQSEKENHLYSASPKELTLMNHSALQFIKSDVINFLKNNKVLVVVDEAHRIKNAEGVWGKSAIEIAKEAHARVILTGTPAPNGYEDLFNLIQFIYPYKYTEIIGIHHKQLQQLTQSNANIKDSRVKSFVENIKPFFVRTKKSELNLPDIFEYKEKVEMDFYQRKIYDFILDKYIPNFQQSSRASFKDTFNKAKLIRLRQAATNPKSLIKPLKDSMERSEDGFDPNAIINDEGISDSEIFQDIQNYSESAIPPKFIKAKEIFEKEILPVNGKVIVWTIFIQNAEQFQEYLEGCGIQSRLLIGKVPQHERENIIKNFNNPRYNQFSIVIANPYAVSESISLHKGCHNAIYMERDFGVANFLQSKNRIHRVGLPENVNTNYYYLVSQDSIDEIINKKLNQKVERMEEMIDQDIPLFSRLQDIDENEIITALLMEYDKRA